ncbi:hypothetical protein GY45DRAFT_218534 [Cubamyces sp. BRFM 1775]|nr:hypothetical protein GY45DRAFT_218534 [Cubamyces sp. BRFM 1775]
MAAYTSLNALTTSASTLAGPVLRQQRSRKFVSVAPSPSLLPSPSLIPFSPSPAPTPALHRPNKAELEARLAGAHVRAHNRRLRQSLGLGLPPSAVPQRTTRAAASSFTSSDATAAAAPTTTTTTKEASPLYQLSYPQAGNPITIPSAPSPSMLPPPPFTPRRPFFPQRRSRAPIHQGAAIGLGLSGGAPGLDASLSSFSAQDAPLTPHHVFPDTLRRTPGAPLRAKPQETAAGASYFHLPADILSPAQAGKGQQATVGLGIFNIALAQEFPVQRPFPVLL